MTHAGWLVNPADDELARKSAALADAKQAEYAAWQKRAELRERMQRIVTIDRSGTARSVEFEESVG